MRGRLARRIAIVAAALALLGAGRYPDVMPGVSAGPGYLLDGPDLALLGPGDLEGRVLPFPVGERIVYAVSYFGVPVGSATIEAARVIESEGRPYVHLVATARTNEFFDTFYRVDDRTEAWVGLDGHVARTRTRTQHGAKETREEVRFDWATHFVHVRRVKVHKNQVRDLAFDFGPFVYDVFDAFYALRAVPFRPGMEVELPVYASRKVHGFRLRALHEREISSPALGAVDALELRPLDTVDGEAHDNGRGRVYVTTDARRLPFQIEGWFRTTTGIRVGGVLAELRSWTPPDPAWPGWRPPAWQPPPVAPDSVEGRPIWEPPQEVRDAREAAGIEAYERKFDLASAAG